MSRLRAMSTSRHKELLIAAVFCLSIALILALNPVLGVQLLPSPSGIPQATDFAYSFTLVRSFWLGSTPGIYSAPEISQALQSWLHGDASTITPIPNPLSPTIIAIWLPLFLVSGSSLEGAFWWWLAISIGAVALALLSVIRRLPSSRVEAWLVAAVVLACCISPIGQTTATIGQTSLYAVGVLTVLAMRLAKSTQASLKQSLVLGTLLFLASIKLPYLCVGASLVVMARQWRALWWCGALCGMTLAIGALWSYPTWFYGYLQTMQRYSAGKFTEGGFWWGNFHAESAIWMHLTAGVIPREIASLANTFAVCVGLGAYIRLFVRSTTHPLPYRLTATIKITLATFLLFAPYLGEYEELLLLIYLLVALGTGTFSMQSCRGRWIALFTILALSSGSLPVFIRYIIKASVFLVPLPSRGEQKVSHDTSPC